MGQLLKHSINTGIPCRRRAYTAIRTRKLSMRKSVEDGEVINTKHICWVFFYVATMASIIPSKVEARPNPAVLAHFLMGFVHWGGESSIFRL